MCWFLREYTRYRRITYGCPNILSGEFLWQSCLMHQARNGQCVHLLLLWVELSWVGGFYALSASKAIFRARTYNCNLFSPVMMITWWIKLGGNRPPGDNPRLFSIRIFYMPSRTDEAGHTKAFDNPVAEHWRESQRTKRSLVGFEPTSAHTYMSLKSNALLLLRRAFVSPG